MRKKIQMETARYFNPITFTELPSRIDLFMALSLIEN